MHADDVKRIGMLLLAYTLNTLVIKWTAVDDYLDVVEALRVSCLVVIFLVSPLCCLLAHMPCMKDDHQHGESIQLSPFQIFKWVYGIGFFLLTLVYSLMGLAIAPLFWYTVGLAGLAVDDTVLRLRAGGRVNLFNILSLGSAVVSVLFLLAFSQHSTMNFREEVDKGDWFTIGAGIGLPISAPLFAYSLRFPGWHTCRQIVHYTHIGVPSAILLAVSIISATQLRVQPQCSTATHRLWRELANEDDNSTLNYTWAHATPSRFVATHANFNTSWQYRGFNLTVPEVQPVAEPEVQPVAESEVQPEAEPEVQPMGPIEPQPEPEMEPAGPVAEPTTMPVELVEEPESDTDTEPDPEPRASQQNFINITESTPEPVKHIQWYRVILLPFTMVPTIILTIRTILDCVVLDVMCVTVFLAAAKHLAVNPASAASEPALMFAGLALIFRLLMLTGSIRDVDLRALTKYDTPHEEEDEDEEPI